MPNMILNDVKIYRIFSPRFRLNVIHVRWSLFNNVFSCTAWWRVDAKHEEFSTQPGPVGVAAAKAMECEVVTWLAEEVVIRCSDPLS